MNLEHFENRLNKKFEDFQPNVDDDAIWNNIESHLPGNEKRRRFFWILFGVLLFLVFVSVFAFNSLNDANIDEQKVAKEDMEKLATDPNDPLVELSESTLESIQNNIKDGMSAQGQEQASELISDQFAERLKLVEERLDDLLSKASQDSPVMATEINEDLVELEANPIADVLSETEQMPSFLSPIQLLDRKRISFSSELNFAEFPLQANFTELIAVKDGSKKFSNGLHVGISYLKPMISRSSLEGDMDLLDLRTSAENTFEALQTEVLFEYGISRSFSFLAGVRYMMNNWQSVHVLCEEELNEEQGLRYTLITKTTQSRIGRDHVLSIPFILNYKLGSPDKWRINFSLGYEHSIYANSAGFEIDREGIEYDINSDAEDRYKSTFGSFVVSRISVLYPIGNSCDLSFGLDGKLSITGITNENALIGKSYNYYGMNVGVIKQF